MSHYVHFRHYYCYINGCIYVYIDNKINKINSPILFSLDNKSKTMDFKRPNFIFRIFKTKQAAHLRKKLLMFIEELRVNFDKRDGILIKNKWAKKSSIFWWDCHLFWWYEFYSKSIQYFDNVHEIVPHQAADSELDNTFNVEVQLGQHTRKCLVGRTSRHNIIGCYRHLVI